ncbi:MAG: cytochrome c oxidase subunit II [Blastocatellia bacterium]|nr:cytochrome c oxidase subunit II [Blastocatellia bacterium]MCS7157940.1 cytochrome c oxidase subunit II [Blastocatellia bacterium]MCX7752447.1 cytochrome c oxidase subunit II [Blastocatellia bacterium]MDW8167438.1 cytochrome c oxidase subunit II [Acidobacteriota bacterium]MDW8257384.1 cytochrome c oxidase subunit II [Acidobacteriota bacterium]
MWENFPLLPKRASSFAPEVDALYGFLVGVSLFFIALIFLLITVFAIKYRRRSEAEVPPPVRGSLALEITWIVIPLGIVLVVFGWGAVLYFKMYGPAPKEALEVYVVGKQWMWHIQHPTGQREINELHVPAGRPIKLTMATEDVIHSFYIPDFRVKKDVVPGRYTTLWFEATQPGRYRFFCAEYCGTKHSEMGGWVIVMDPVEYQNWLGSGGASAPTESLAQAGERLFQQLACHTCHREDTQELGPSLRGLFGRSVRLADGRTVVADEAYLRESILNPDAKIVAGFSSPSVMPTYQGQITEEQLLQLVAYLKSLGGEQR